MTVINIEDLLQQIPIVTILRGITPEEVNDVGECLYRNGIRIMEVPLNSPRPYESIKKFSDNVGNRCLCGAGTVITPEQVEKVHEAGGKLIVSPNTDTRVIERSLQLGMLPVPGFNTPTEAFTAIAAGAKYLKFFPAADIGSTFFTSLTEVLPTEVKVIATGGISDDNIADWLKLGVFGAGIGSSLYRPGIEIEELSARAAKLSLACRNHKRS